MWEKTNKCPSLWVKRLIYITMRRLKQRQIWARILPSERSLRKRAKLVKGACPILHMPVSRQHPAMLSIRSGASWAGDLEMASLWAIYAKLVLWMLQVPIPPDFLHYRQCLWDQ